MTVVDCKDQYIGHAVCFAFRNQAGGRHTSRILAAHAVEAGADIKSNATIFSTSS